MLIIPALYLSNGNAVSHYKGESGQATVLSRDPLRAARDFEHQGATIIHLVDLDSGSELNKSIAKNIAEKTKLKVWYADGVSSRQSPAAQGSAIKLMQPKAATLLKEIEDFFDAGIDAVSLNQFTENVVSEALKCFGADKILFTIRAQRNVIEGKPNTEVFHYGQDLIELGIRHIIFRDTKIQGSFHPNFDEVEKLILAARGKARIFAFGGIGAMDDIEILKRTGAAGVIISRAFLENRLSLGECIRKFG